MSDQKELIQSVEDIPVERIETKAIEPAMSTTDRLILMALESDVDIEKLDKLIALKNQEEDRKAATVFDKKFANMQRVMPVIKKAKAVKDELGAVVYNYAPLEDIQRECDEIIGKYGFSYRWREETIDKGKRVTMRISGHGHFEETTFDVPPVPSNKWSNAVQAMGSMTTYGHRYTFIAGFGITVEGADDDASYNFDEGVKHADFINAMDSETDRIALHDLLTGYISDLRERGDIEGLNFAKKYYTKRKGELS